MFLSLGPVKSWIIDQLKLSLGLVFGGGAHEPEVKSRSNTDTYNRRRKPNGSRIFFSFYLTMAGSQNYCVLLPKHSSGTCPFNLLFIKADVPNYL